MSKDDTTVLNMPSLEKIIDVCWPLRELEEGERSLVERYRREIVQAALGGYPTLQDAHTLSLKQCLCLKSLLLKSVILEVRRFGVAISNRALDSLRSDGVAGEGTQKDLLERDRLARLALKDPGVCLPLELAMSSWACEEELNILAQSFYPIVRKTVASHPGGVCRSTLEILAKDSDPEVRRIVASLFPLELDGELRSLIRDPDLQVRRGVAKSPLLREEDFEFLLQESDTEILFSLAENPAIKDKHLFSLAARQAQEGSWEALVQKKAASIMRSRFEARESSSSLPPEQQGGEEAPS